MKKMYVIITMIIMSFIVQACSNGLTNEQNDLTGVRLVSLRYKDPASEVSFKYNDPYVMSQEKTLQTALNFIFPGDTLLFTIELEDPNYEFVSLLSIRFNGNIIRANVGDTIITTRDCGLNICIDFPFIAMKDVLDYVVEDVRFVKLNTEGSLSAIIDDNSSSSIRVDVYSSDIYPYVESSVEALNTLFNEITMYSNEALEFILNDENYPSNMLDIIKTRMIRIYDPMYDVLGDARNSNGLATNTWFYPSFLDTYLKVGDNITSFQQISLFPGTDSELLHSVAIDPSQVQQYFSHHEDYYHLYFGILDVRYANILAYSIGNDIYLSLDGEEILLYQMGRTTRFELYTFDNLDSGM